MKIEMKTLNWGGNTREYLTSITRMLDTLTLAAFTSKVCHLVKQIFLILTFLTGALPAWSQLEIIGTVISSEDRSILPGVIVLEKGTQNGTVTSSDGTFSLIVSDSNAIIEFLHIGFVKQEVSINEKLNILVKMKVDCIRDYFDTNTIELYVQSGLINTPVGGQLLLALPYFTKGTLSTGFSYQTNLKKVQVVNGQVEFKHFVWTCNFDVGASWYYRGVYNGDLFNSKAHSFESKMSFRRLSLIVGYSNLHLHQIETNVQRTSSGLMTGLGTYIGRPFRMTVTGKVAVYKNNTEYFGQITRNSRHANLFLKFYKLDSFSELSLGIGIKMYYRLRKSD